MVIFTKVVKYIDAPCTNQVLLGLLLQFRYPNVIVLTTSNITGAIDLAFVDRLELRNKNSMEIGVFTCVFYPVCIESNISLNNLMFVSFVFRADIKQYIGPPSPKAIYKIYHSCIKELVRVSIRCEKTM